MKAPRPTHGKHADWQNTPCLTCREDRIGDGKRLTDAELAAEVWCQETEFRAAVIRGDYPALDRLATMERFAAHPHYDEADS